MSAPNNEEIPPERLVTVDGPRKLTDEQRERLKALAARPDSEIDFTDIPEIEFTENVEIGRYYRGRIAPEEPLPEGKVRVTLVLDEAVVDAFMEQADESGGKVRHHDLINEALKAWIASH